MAKQAEILGALFELINERRHADPDISYTAQLLAGGVALCARKLGEEAVETSIASIAETSERVVSESADLLYHWLVLMAAANIHPDRVYEKLAERMKEKKEGTKERKKDDG